MRSTTRPPRNARSRCARRTASALEQLGVDVIDAAPDELAVRLADHYLMLKRQGLL